MNPFDGTLFCYHRILVAQKVYKLINPIPHSHQAAHANPKLEQDVPIHGRLCALRLQTRRPPRILHLLPDDPLHDRSFYGFTIPRLRIDLHRVKP